MTWVKLDDTFYDNPKVEKAGLAGAGLYAKALSYSGRHLTDGFIPRSFVKAHGSPAAAAKLEAAELWIAVEDGWQIKDYLEFNFSREDALARREDISAKRAEAGRKGALAKWQNAWQNDGKPDGKRSGPDPTRQDPEPGCKSPDVSVGSKTPDFKIPELRSVDAA